MYKNIVMAGEKEVIVINVENNEEKRFYSLVKASEYFGVSKYVISKHILLKKEKLFNGKYIIKYSGIKSSHINFRYNIGDVISDDKGHIQILKQTIVNNNLSYEYKCLNCGYQGVVTQYNLIKRKIRCSSCCKNSKIVNNKNCLSTTTPWILEYLKNKEDGKKYLPGSSKKITFKCPICGEERMSPINYIVSQGFNCLKCGKSISYPNKLMRIILEKSGIDFEYEKKFEWSFNKRYDFYIPSKNIIIEVDGSQHLYDNIKENDIIKETLAIDNGVNIIRVKAYNSNYKYIKNELNKIDFFKILDLNEVNIEECDILLKKNDEMYQKIINLWNNGYTVLEISNELNIKKFNIRNYLKKLNDLGLIKYDGIKEINRKTRIKVLDLLTNEIYESISECSKKNNISRETIKRNNRGRFKFFK